MATPLQADWSNIVTIIRRQSRWVFAEIHLELYRRALQVIEPLSGPLAAEFAAAYLNAQAIRLDSELQRQAQVFPSHWWMLLLRYISPSIFGCYGGNYARYRGYAERVSAWSERNLEGVAAASLMGESQIKRALRFAVTAAVREDLHSAAGRVAAGACLEPDPNYPYRAVMDHDLTQAMDRYSTQLRSVDQDVFTRMGAAYLTPNTVNLVCLDWSGPTV